MGNTAVSRDKYSTWLRLVLYLSLDMPPRAVFPVQTRGSALSITYSWIDILKQVAIGLDYLYTNYTMISKVIMYVLQLPYYIKAVVIDKHVL